MKNAFILTVSLLGIFFCKGQNAKLKIEIPFFDKEVFAVKDIPEYYDLRSTGRLGFVKIQPNGGCWASAAIGSVESVRRTSLDGNETLSDINLKLFHGFVPERNSNGNHYMATAYFSRRSGPLIKNPETDSLYNPVPRTVHYITQARYLPDDQKIIKKTIMDYGAVYSMMHFKKNDIDTLTDIIYTSINKINHAVILVGWNDTLPTKKGMGAWIAQNSLGTSFGDDGFFFIPYQDPNILKYNAIWPEWIPFEENSRIYYYDTLGSFRSYGFRDTVCYGLVKFTAEQDLILTKIATHINNAESTIYGEIYNHFDTSTKVLTGLMGTTQITQCKFAGYYTVDLEIPVNIGRRKDFYIMMKYITPYDTLPLPIETFIEGYSNPHITAKKCWINPDWKRWPSAWYECGTESNWPVLDFDLCIRAYCKNRKE